MARLIWTEPALEDLGRIAEYIALDNPAAARKLVSRVFAKAGLLEDFPEMCPVARELPGGRYRHLGVRPLRIFYRIEDDQVFIIYVMRSERLFRSEDLEEREYGTD